MNSSWLMHAAALLSNGSVLAVGGLNESGTLLRSSEMYDPSTRTWTASGSMHYARQQHTASILKDEKVLVTGGYDGVIGLMTSELYDPARGTWTDAASMNYIRTRHTASLLANGKVLVTGGAPLHELSGELYDPSTGIWNLTEEMDVQRYNHAASLLTNGQVLVTGGDTDFGTSTGSQLYDVSTNAWTQAERAMNQGIALERMPRYTIQPRDSGQPLVA